MSSIDVESNIPTHELQFQDVATSSLLEGNAQEVLLHDLQAQVRIIGKMKPSLSELAALYHQRKSRIDQFVAWYANQPLWGKVFAGGVVVSASYTLGAFMGVAWVLTSLVTALYAVAILIIEEHAELMKQRDTLFLDDIPKMEALLEASIESFRVLEDKLTAVFQSLIDLSTKRAEGISEFEENVDVMSGHNLRYESLIEALGETAKRLLAHQEGVALDEVELNGLCSELQHRLQEAEVLTSTLSGLVSTVEQELAHNMTSELLDPQDEVHAPAISHEAAVHFSKIDRELELLRNPNKAMNTSNTAPVHQNDEDFANFDQAMQALLRADNVSKGCHQSRQDKSSGGYTFVVPSLF